MEEDLKQPDELAVIREAISELRETIADLRAERKREALNLDEAAAYLGVKKSHLYKLTHQRLIPYYKPGGKSCYFKRAELDEWLLSNRVSTSSELNTQAIGYCIKNKPNLTK